MHKQLIFIMQVELLKAKKLFPKVTIALELEHIIFLREHIYICIYPFVKILKETNYVGI